MISDHQEISGQYGRVVNYSIQRGLRRAILSSLVNHKADWTILFQSLILSLSNLTDCLRMKWDGENQIYHMRSWNSLGSCSFGSWVTLYHIYSQSKLVCISKSSGGLNGTRNTFTLVDTLESIFPDNITAAGGYSLADGEKVHCLCPWEHTGLILAFKGRCKF